MSSLLRALFNGTSKHKKLSEEWATIREPVVEGVTFYCKYLGSTLVDDPKGEASTAEAIKRIIHAAKQVSRKPERVSLHVSLQGIRMADTTTSELLLHTSIYKISYCSADAHYDHVFAFIATNDNDTCECHAFLCSKRKMAQAVTVSIAQAFNLAYEYWKMTVEDRHTGEIFAHEELPAEVKVSSALIQNGSIQVYSQPSSQTSSPIPIRSDFGSSDMSSSGYQSSTQALLIDLEGFSEQTSTETSQDNKVESSSSSNILCKPWDGFGDFDEINDGFERLALRRENQNRLPGISPQRWVDLDLASLTDHPPASQTGSGFWQLGRSPPSSSTASSPTDPWLLGQSPPDVWEDFSGSPNMVFLNSCQSPPSQLMFTNSSVKNTLVPCEMTKDPFIQCKVGEDPLVPSISENNRVPSKTVEKSVNCGTIKDPFSQSDGVKDPFTSNHISEDPFTCERNPFSPSQPEKSRTSCSITGCNSGQPLWGNDLFDGQKGKNVLCS